VYNQNCAMSKRRIEFRDGSVLEVSLSGAESHILRVCVVPAVTHASNYRSLGAPSPCSDEENDEAFERGRELEYDASIGQTDPAPVLPRREMSRAAMLLPHVEDIFRVMNQRGAITEMEKLTACTDVLSALNLLMDELDRFLGLGDDQRYQPLLLEFQNVILKHCNKAWAGVEGDGESGLSAEYRSQKRPRTEDGDERHV